MCSRKQRTINNYLDIKIVIHRAHDTHSNKNAITNPIHNERSD